MSRETRRFGSLLTQKLRIAVGSMGLDRWSVSGTFKGKGEAYGGGFLPPGGLAGYVFILFQS
jgi:hypothetical protein